MEIERATAEKASSSMQALHALPVPRSPPHVLLFPFYCIHLYAPLMVSCLQPSGFASLAVQRGADLRLACKKGYGSSHGSNTKFTSDLVVTYGGGVHYVADSTN